MSPTILITGASQGIGRATAERFAYEGYRLILAARQEERLNALAQDLSSRRGVETLALPTDVSNPVQVAALIEAGIDRFGAIDVLINNAGIYCSGPIESFSLEDWHTVIDTNLWGYIHTIHAVLPGMLAKGKGTIINIGSIGSEVPLAYLVPYTTSKFAVQGLTEALHSELAAKGIHVGGIYPNLIKSDFLERAIFRGHDPEEQRRRRHQIEQILDVPFVEKPEQVADAVWKMVIERQEKVLLGSAQVTSIFNRLLPPFMRWLPQQVFSME
ncbi:MAG: 3-phenylpropionate-dihydrodiol/cinnamic acid-dihydrodiol dehydrogenase [Chroococcopsis gigantea SAG 12.99]|jgi:short-subunit dehydrogenase|nr:SDR family oxidoreductase [Chlorogloea purpurea SAG 13.99]MDV3000282.1 3-phenylpropionate-dihydrodiol/cinnamic acid-dihydrodiol dehydrogenase [Chroococcopsis gigantea SAG 12.99]